MSSKKSFKISSRNSWKPSKKSRTSNRKDCIQFDSDTYTCCQVDDPKLCCIFSDDAQCENKKNGNQQCINRTQYRCVEHDGQYKCFPRDKENECNGNDGSNSIVIPLFGQDTITTNGTLLSAPFSIAFSDGTFGKGINTQPSIVTSNSFLFTGPISSFISPLDNIFIKSLDLFFQFSAPYASSTIDRVLVHVCVVPKTIDTTSKTAEGIKFGSNTLVMDYDQSFDVPDPGSDPLFMSLSETNTQNSLEISRGDKIFVNIEIFFQNQQSSASVAVSGGLLLHKIQ